MADKDEAPIMLEVAVDTRHPALNPSDKLDRRALARVLRIIADAIEEGPDHPGGDLVTDRRLLAFWAFHHKQESEGMAS